MFAALAGRQADNSPLFASILRHIDKASFNGFRRRAHNRNVSIDAHRALGWFRNAEKGLHEFTAPSSDQTVKAQNFTLLQRKADAFKVGGIAVTSMTASFIWKG